MASAGGPSVPVVVNRSGDVWTCIECGELIQPRTTHACAPQTIEPQPPEGA